MQTNKSNNVLCISNRQQCESMMVIKKEKIKRRYLNQGQCSNKILFISLLVSHNQLQWHAQWNSVQLNNVIGNSLLLSYNYWFIKLEVQVSSKKKKKNSNIKKPQ